MRILKRMFPATWLVMLALLLASNAWAQADPPQVRADNSSQPTIDTAAQPTVDGSSQPAGDPPGRVARVDYMTGQVSVQPHGTDDWVQAETNRPLTNADNVWADKDSRAELDFGTGFMRINSETSLTLSMSTMMSCKCHCIRAR